MDLQFPICTECGRMIEDTEDGSIVIISNPDNRERPLLQSSLSDSGISFVYHRDVCDGVKIATLDPVKVLSERNLLPKT